jgi:hypothetical protein
MDGGSERFGYPDPVLRVADEMNMHASVVSFGGGEMFANGYGYAVFSLETGIPVTHDIYPSRGDARRIAERHTTDHLLILQIQPDGMPLREAEAVLKYERSLISMGVRTPDFMETEENSGAMSRPHQKWDRYRMAQQLKAGKPLTPEGVAYSNLTPKGVPPAFLRKAN